MVLLVAVARGSGQAFTQACERQQWARPIYSSTTAVQRGSVGVDGGCMAASSGARSLTTLHGEGSIVLQLNQQDYAQLSTTMAAALKLCAIR